MKLEIVIRAALCQPVSNAFLKSARTG
nr:hypothetical protein [Pseudomonas aeruginosa]